MAEPTSGSRWWLYALFLLFMLAGGATAFFFFGRPASEAGVSSADEVAGLENEKAPPSGDAASDPLPTGSMTNGSSASDVPPVATLVLAPHHPATVLTVNGEHIGAAPPTKLEVEAGREHEVVYSLDVGRYSSRKTVRLTLAEGESRTLSDLLPRPATLTVRADLGSPQLNVWLDGRYLGETPVDGVVLGPGAASLGVAADTTAGPTRVHDLRLVAGERLVLTFSSAADAPLSNRRP